MLGAQVGDALDVALGRRVHAAGADHRLAEEGGHVLGPDALDLGLQRGQRVVRDRGDGRDQRAPVARVRLDAADAGAEAVRAVVALRAADQVHALRMALLDPVAAGDLGRGVDRVAAARGEEDARALHRRVRGEPLAELVGGPVAEVAEGRVGLEAAHLLRDARGDLAVAVADVGVPEARGPVEVAAVLAVVDPDPLPALDQQLALGDRTHVGERVPEAGRGGGGSGSHAGHRIAAPAARNVQSPRADGSAQASRARSARAHLVDRPARELASSPASARSRGSRRRSGVHSASTPASRSASQ